MNVLAIDLSGYLTVDSVFVMGAVAVAKNTDRVANIYTRLGEKMVFGDQGEMTGLAINLAKGQNMTMNHFGNRITITHKGPAVGISWTRANVTHTVTFNTNDLLTQLDPQVAIEYLSR